VPDTKPFNREKGEHLAAQLEAHPDYRVLRRLAPRTQFAIPDDRPMLKGVIVDTETTGLDPANDKIVEIGLVVFEFDPETGQAFRVLATYDSLEDPGIPIPAEVTDVTGITDAMVAGQKIDDEKVAALVRDAALVVAHNARFDRPFLEQRLPIFETLPWGCSFAQIDWRGEGVGSAKLDYIAYQYGFFFDAHRADTDCHALLEILQRPLPKSAVIALKRLADQTQQKDWCVYALNSKFETKDLLKARAYQWNAERKTWHRTVSGTEAITGEVAWLKESIYGGRTVKLEFEVRDAMLRYSKRPGKTVFKDI
jgi:DNA polymerase-3 subunit epsilon